MENQGTVKVKFPRETNTKSGWAIDPSFIARVRHSIPPDEDEWIPSHEEVQAVLLAIECIPAGIFTQPKQFPMMDEMAKQMKERCDSMEMRGAFADGWLSAEAAHGIKGEE